MKIDIVRAGGFAGIEQTLASVDLRDLPAESAQRVRDLVQRLSERSGEKVQEGADRFEYRIDLREPGTASQKVVVIDEGDPANPAMADLAALLEALGAAPQG